MARQTTVTDSGGYTRTTYPPRSPHATAWHCPDAGRLAWPVFGGDELRVRAWLWRVLGVGVAAAGRQQ